MNIEAVRAFVAVAEEGQFQDAALTLGISQQAVSKRVASLERSLEVVLFTRGARRTTLTIDGRAFLPHAKTLLAAADRAVQSVRPGTRALRVDVLGRRLASADLLWAFHDAHPAIDLDVVTLPDANAAIAALLEGGIDAAFGCLRDPAAVPVEHVRVYDEPLQVLVGPDHPLADARTVRMSELRPFRLWVPGIMRGSEWAAFYDALARDFDVVIDSTGPNFGLEHLLDVITDSPTVVTFVGERLRIAWPNRHELRRIPLSDPAPLYPWSFLWRNDSPAVAALRDHLIAGYSARHHDAWLPFPDRLGGTP